jgi:4-hydroxybenzoate polyprenyltransferase
LKGKASLKEGLAKDSHVDVTVLPYDPAVITLIEQARASGRSIVLATASHISLANRVADHLQIFDKVVATNGSLNLSSHLKRDVLVEQYGNEGFDYIGNSLDDIVVWASARKAYVVNPERGVEKRAAAQGNVEEIIRSNTTRPKDWIKALRLHQWMKNILIFVPLLTAHLLTNIPFVLQGLLAFLFFGLCASSVYLLNDLLDLNDDRHHKSKRNRPFASGKLSIRVGLLAFPSLLGIAFIGSAVLLPWEFTATLIGYYILTLAYSLSMKRKMVVDVISLALLYTIRIIAGACALNLELTFWILAFSMFMFLSLALVKRYAELREAKHSGRTEKTRGRGYYPDDLEMISSLGAASGYLAVMVLAMYIHDPATTRLYSHPQIIWLACPILLFWISRIWMLTHRGKMHDDPVMFAVSDRTSIVAGLLMGLVFWVAA